MNRPFCRSGRAREESGAALILALFLAIFAVGITVTGTTILRANRTRTETEFVLHGQASQFARSGLTDAVNWLRRQAAQPVASFAPQRDLTANPQIIDTDDPDIGLVREFQITGSTWGRYEVWKEWSADPDLDRAAFRTILAARDVTQMRDGTVPGSTWLLQCIGYVYERRDPNSAFDQGDNRILAQETLELEVSRLALALPGLAAINGSMGGPVVIHNNVEVSGGSTAAGIFYKTGKGSPNVQGTVAGAPALAPSGIYNDSPQAVFGVTEEVLRSMADFIITDMANFPVPVPPNSIIFVDTKSVSFDNLRPLQGSGLVYVKGNLNMQSGNASLFSGLLYVEGHINIKGPSEFRGSIVGKKGINVEASGGPIGIYFDQGALDALLDAFGNYRTSRTLRLVHER